MVLTNKQKEELDAAVLSYLKQAGAAGAAAAFATESGLPAAALTEEAEEKHRGILEKKWTAIVRLQSKILQLEQQNASLQEDLRLYGGGKKVDKSEALPRDPAEHTLQGHRGPVTRVAFHPRYNVLVSSSEDGTVRVWDHDGGTFERTLKGHGDAVQDVTFNGDGSVLATCSADLTVKLWDFEKGSVLRTLKGHDHNVSSVVFTPGGASVLTASRDKTIKLWDSASGYCTRTLVGHEQWVRAARVSPSGALVASCSMDQTVKIWNLATGECLRTLRDHDHVIETVEFTDTAKADENIRAMMAADGVAPTPAGGAGSGAGAGAGAAGGAGAAPGGEAQGGAFIATASRDKTIRLWEVETGRCVKVLNGHDNWVRSLVFHPSGRYLLSSADDKTVRVWDLSKNGRLCRTLDNAHTLFVSCLAWNRTHPVLATGGVDMMVKVWECR